MVRDDSISKQQQKGMEKDEELTLDWETGSSFRCDRPRKCRQLSGFMLRSRTVGDATLVGHLARTRSELEISAIGE